MLTTRQNGKVIRCICGLCRILYFEFVKGEFESLYFVKVSVEVWTCDENCKRLRQLCWPGPGILLSIHVIPPALDVEIRALGSMLSPPGLLVCRRQFLLSLAASLSPAAQYYCSQSHTSLMDNAWWLNICLYSSALMEHKSRPNLQIHLQKCSSELAGNLHTSLVIVQPFGKQTVLLQPNISNFDSWASAIFLRPVFFLFFNA